MEVVSSYERVARVKVDVNSSLIVYEVDNIPQILKCRFYSVSLTGHILEDSNNNGHLFICPIKLNGDPFDNGLLRFSSYRSQVEDI